MAYKLGDLIRINTVINGYTLDRLAQIMEVNVLTYVINLEGFNNYIPIEKLLLETRSVLLFSPQT